MWSPLSSKRECWRLGRRHRRPAMIRLTVAFSQPFGRHQTSRLGEPDTDRIQHRSKKNFMEPVYVA